MPTTGAESSIPGWHDPARDGNYRVKQLVRKLRTFNVIEVETTSWQPKHHFIVRSKSTRAHDEGRVRVLSETGRVYHITYQPLKKYDTTIARIRTEGGTSYGPLTRVKVVKQNGANEHWKEIINNA